MPYSLIHCKTIRTGIHKGNPIVPFVESARGFYYFEKGKRIAARLVALAMTENGEKRIATAVTRLRNDGEGETDC